MVSRIKEKESRARRAAAEDLRKAGEKRKRNGRSGKTSMTKEHLECVEVIASVLKSGISIVRLI